VLFFIKTRDPCTEVGLQTPEVPKYVVGPYLSPKTAA